MNMYELYYNKEKLEIILKKVKKTNLLIGEDQKNVYYGDEPIQYNDCYITCGLLEPLKKIAIELKNEWLLEAKNKVEKIQALRL